MTRQVPFVPTRLVLPAVLLLLVPLAAFAAEAELRVELLTPVTEPYGGALSGDLPEVSAGFPALAVGLFSDDVRGVPGDNRCGLVAHYDRASWAGYRYAMGSLLVAWRQSVARSPSGSVFLGLGAGPTWFGTPGGDAYARRESGILDVVWTVTPTLEAVFGGPLGTPLLVGVGYRAYLKNFGYTFPFDSGFVCQVGVVWRLD